jgi:menaquinone-dependent protoporphyrinogen IX oxidase
MKVLVTYMSNTGNTKKVAEAIFEEINGEKKIIPIDEVNSIDGYDITFLGFPIKQMGPDKKTKKFLNKHCIQGRDVVLFITHAAPEESPELQPMLDKFRHEASEANIVDMFDCQGELSKTIKRIMSIMPNADLRRWAKEDNSFGQPDETRIEKARAFARDVIKRYHDNHQGIDKAELSENSGNFRVSDPILT